MALLYEDKENPTRKPWASVGALQQISARQRWNSREYPPLLNTRNLMHEQENHPWVRSAIRGPNLVCQLQCRTAYGASWGRTLFSVFRGR